MASGLGTSCFAFKNAPDVSRAREKPAKPVCTCLALGLAAAMVVRWLGLPRRFVVADRSMEPSLEPGDRLLAVPYRWCGLRVGNVVVLRDPALRTRTLVKRVHAVLADGRFDVRGDNVAHSRDSRAFGPVAPDLVRGVVLWRYLPPARRGAVR